MAALETAASVLGGLVAIQEVYYRGSNHFKGWNEYTGPLARAGAEVLFGLELGHADLSVNVAAGPANHAKTRTASFTIVAATAGISFPVGFGVDSAVVNTPPDKNPTGKELSGLYFRGAGIGGAFFVSAGVGTVRLGRGHGYLYSNPFGGNPFKGYAIHHVPNWLNFGGGVDFFAFGISLYHGYSEQVNT